MIYLDSSVVLARLFDEDRVPPARLWQQPLTSSRLLEYEIKVRLHARRVAQPVHDAADQLLGPVSTLGLTVEILGRAIQPFPLQVRTLDALHLATMVYLIGQDQPIELATYDRRLADAAVELGIPLAKL